MRSWLAIVTAMFLAACAAEKPSLSAQAELDYNKAKEMVEAHRFGEAAVFLEHFTAKHPYSKYAPQAELLRIYTTYMDDQAVLSEVLADRFLTQHPKYVDRDYAMYMLAMSHYKERASAERDATHTTAAVKIFKRLIKEYPRSAYAVDASGRLQQLYNELAGHELTVARYYFKGRRFVAAANRAQIVVTQFQTAPQIEEALYLLAASYHQLGLNTESAEVAQLLRHNYPDSHWSHALSSM
ncbi:MAG: outer membrane protein assembly factor BamD [Mariprofundales bacterium]|nr:outer membrane protein assembly factor BamD [Mariprofundales bacterium]